MWRTSRLQPFIQTEQNYQWLKLQILLCFKCWRRLSTQKLQVVLTSLMAEWLTRVWPGPRLKQFERALLQLCKHDVCPPSTAGTSNRHARFGRARCTSDGGLYDDALAYVHLLVFFSLHHLTHVYCVFLTCSNNPAYARVLSIHIDEIIEHLFLSRYLARIVCHRLLYNLEYFTTGHLLIS
jgi:hypothetical protein